MICSFYPSVAVRKIGHERNTTAFLRCVYSFSSRGMKRHLPSLQPASVYFISSAQFCMIVTNPLLRLAATNWTVFRRSRASAGPESCAEGWFSGPDFLTSLLHMRAGLQSVGWSLFVNATSTRSCICLVHRCFPLNAMDASFFFFFFSCVRRLPYIFLSSVTATPSYSRRHFHIQGSMRWPGGRRHPIRYLFIPTPPPPPPLRSSPPIY